MRADSPPPNMRVQRTRSSPSAPHSPLTRRPLGGGSRSGALAMALLLACSVASSIPSKESEVLTPAALGLSDQNLYARVGSVLWQAEATEGFQHLSSAERTVCLVFALEAEVQNGGFAQFFANSSGEFARETSAALAAVGASATDALLRQALEPFGPEGPSRSSDLRNGQLKAIGPKADELWGRLDEEFYREVDDLAVLTAKYIRAHAREIRGLHASKAGA